MPINQKEEKAAIQYVAERFVNYLFSQNVKVAVFDSDGTLTFHTAKDNFIERYFFKKPGYNRGYGEIKVERKQDLEKIFLNPTFFRAVLQEMEKKGIIPVIMSRQGEGPLNDIYGISYTNQNGQITTIKEHIKSQGGAIIGITTKQAEFRVDKNEINISCQELSFPKEKSEIIAELISKIDPTKKVAVFDDAEAKEIKKRNPERTICFGGDGAFCDHSKFHDKDLKEREEEPEMSTDEKGRMYLQKTYRLLKAPDEDLHKHCQELEIKSISQKDEKGNLIAGEYSGLSPASVASFLTSVGVALDDKKLYEANIKSTAEGIKNYEALGNGLAKPQEAASQATPANSANSANSDVAKPQNVKPNLTNSAKSFAIKKDLKKVMKDFDQKKSGVATPSKTGVKVGGKSAAPTNPTPASSTTKTTTDRAPIAKASAPTKPVLATKEAANKNNAPTQRAAAGTSATLPRAIKSTPTKPANSASPTIKTTTSGTPSAPIKPAPTQRAATASATLPRASQVTSKEPITNPTKTLEPKNASTSTTVKTTGASRVSTALNRAHGPAQTGLGINNRTQESKTPLAPRPTAINSAAKTSATSTTTPKTNQSISSVLPTASKTNGRETSAPIKPAPTQRTTATASATLPRASQVTPKEPANSASPTTSRTPSAPIKPAPTQKPAISPFSTNKKPSIGANSNPTSSETKTTDQKIGAATTSKVAQTNRTSAALEKARGLQQPSQNSNKTPTAQTSSVARPTTNSATARISTPTTTKGKSPVTPTTSGVNGKTNPATQKPVSSGDFKTTTNQNPNLKPQQPIEPLPAFPKKVDMSEIFGSDFKGGDQNATHQQTTHFNMNKVLDGLDGNPNTNLTQTTKSTNETPRKAGPKTLDINKIELGKISKKTAENGKTLFISGPLPLSRENDNDKKSVIKGIAKRIKNALTLKSKPSTSPNNPEGLATQEIKGKGK